MTAPKTVPLLSDNHASAFINLIFAPFLVFTLVACTTSSQTTNEGTNLAPRTASEVQVVVINTSFGRIVIELNDARTPLHAKNFREIIEAGTLNGTTFHRVIPGFIIQGGDPNSRDDDRSNDGFGGPGHTVPFEAGLAARRGSVVMARTPDEHNPSKASNGSQFYILLRDAPELTGVDTVFGRVIIGMDVVERISKLPADENDNPIEMVAMTATLTSFEKARGLPTFVAQ